MKSTGNAGKHPKHNGVRSFVPPYLCRNQIKIKIKIVLKETKSPGRSYCERSWQTSPIKGHKQRWIYKEPRILGDYQRQLQIYCSRRNKGQHGEVSGLFGNILQSAQNLSALLILVNFQLWRDPERWSPLALGEQMLQSGSSKVWMTRSCNGRPRAKTFQKSQSLSPERWWRWCLPDTECVV